MAKKLNWDRAHSEDLGRLRGYHDIGSNPPPPNPPTPPKSNPPEPNPPKNKCKVVPVQQISGYLQCDHGKLVTSLQHLAEANGAVEVTTGEWVRVQRTAAPPGHREVEPMCPLCNWDMVRKVGERGPFLSCARWPACRGTRPV